jgi:hypothetical protein
MRPQYRALLGLELADMHGTLRPIVARKTWSLRSNYHALPSPALNTVTSKSMSEPLNRFEHHQSKRKTSEYHQ